MFTIEVKKRGKDEEFSFEDLRNETEVVHDDCYKGKAEWRDLGDYIGYIGNKLFIRDGPGCWIFTCLRCEGKIEIRNPNAPLEIVKTALDGQERKITDKVRVIQKT